MQIKVCRPIFSAALCGGLLYCSSDAGAGDMRGWVGRANSQFSARISPAMAFDSSRGVLVAFGGFLAGGYDVRDTWEWNSVSWNRVATTGPRVGSRMVFDAARGVCLLGPSGSSPETWSWDGTEWELLSTVGPRYVGAMVYDAGRGVPVLYEYPAAASRIWEWDGSQWDLRFTGGPRGLFGPSMSYDAARGQCLFFGGSYSPSKFVIINSDETWAWDGENWTFLGAGGPPGRTRAAMSYDPVRDRTVLFGGQVVQDCGGHACTPQLLDDTWEWNGSAWGRVVPAVSPIRRAEAGVAYDPFRLRTLLSGGMGNRGEFGNGLADTWSYNGEWSRAGVPGPPARQGHVLVYDSARNVTVLWGQSWGAGSDADSTWEWNGKKWRMAATTGPVSLTEEPKTAVYDSDRKVVVLYYAKGGTWEWDGVAWKQRRDAAGSPPARTGFMMFYDPVRKATIVGAGFVGPNNMTEMWSWNGLAWSLLPTQTPVFRRSFATFDTARSRAVAVGRPTEMNGPFETWEWDGAVWRLLTLNGPSDAQSLAYDSQRRMVHLQTGGTFTGESEHWTWDGAAWELLPTDYSRIPAGPIAYDAARDKFVSFAEKDRQIGDIIDGLWEYGSLFPEVIEHPQSRTVRAGERVLLFTDIAGGHPIHYQWRLNGVPIGGGGGNGPSFVMDPMIPEWAGFFDCVVNNAYGTATTRPARVQVLDAAAPARQ